jgi:uncharacterized protein (TIGR02145 family)
LYLVLGEVIRKRNFGVKLIKLQINRMITYSYELEKSKLLIRPSLLLGVFLLVAISCKKDGDNGGNGNNSGIPVMTTDSVTDITQNSAKSGGNVTSDGGSTITARGVCWSTGQIPTISDNKTKDGTGAGNFISSISDLSANTTYYIRAYATNSNGTGYGSSVSFTTLQSITYGSFTDPRDGNVYQTVIIGNQEWMAENLKYLPSVAGSNTGSETTPYYYVYGYEGTNVNNAQATANYSTYGVLYNWPAAMNLQASSNTNPSGVQGVCPTGWHLPSDDEWTELTNYLDGTSVAGAKLKETGTTHWISPNTGATNETGFTALPGGGRGDDQVFGYYRSYGYWWSATEKYTFSAWNRVMHHGTIIVYRSSPNKQVGFSVRCLKD